MTKWVEELDTIEEMLKNSVSLEKIGDKYDVTKQRMYQILTKYGIDTPIKKRKNYLKDKPPKAFWLNRMLTNKKIPRAEKLKFIETLEIPDVCPILGLTLNYDGVKKSGWTRTDNSPSIDRIDSSKGYTIGNIQIISWRANRIKNDSTPEELMKIAKYMEHLTKNNLQL
jgi:hypothetical protein